MDILNIKEFFGIFKNTNIKGCIEYPKWKKINNVDFEKEISSDSGFSVDISVLENVDDFEISKHKFTSFDLVDEDLLDLEILKVNEIRVFHKDGAMGYSHIRFDFLLRR